MTNIFKDVAPVEAEKVVLVELWKRSTDTNDVCRCFAGCVMSHMGELLKNVQSYSLAKDVLFNWNLLKSCTVSGNIFPTKCTNLSREVALSFLSRASGVVIFVNEVKIIVAENFYAKKISESDESMFLKMRHLLATAAILVREMNASSDNSMRLTAKQMVSRLFEVTLYVAAVVLITNTKVELVALNSQSIQLGSRFSSSSDPSVKLLEHEMGWYCHIYDVFFRSWMT